MDRKTLCICPEISRDKRPYQTCLAGNSVCTIQIRLARQTIGLSELTTNKKLHCPPLLLHCIWPISNASTKPEGISPGLTPGMTPRDRVMFANGSRAARPNYRTRSLTRSGKEPDQKT